MFLPALWAAVSLALNTWNFELPPSAPPPVPGHQLYYAQNITRDEWYASAATQDAASAKCWAHVKWGERCLSWGRW